MLMSGHFAASLAMLLIAAIFYLVAIGTNSWSTSGQVLTFGLWKFCMDTEGKKEWRCVPNKTDFSLAAQAFSMLAVLCYAVSFLMYLAYIVFPSLGRSRPVTMALCLLGFSVGPVAREYSALATLSSFSLSTQRFKQMTNGWKCLQDLVDTSSQSLECPLCRKQTSVPRGGVCKFQINFYIADDIQRRQTTEYCPQHPEEELRYYCVNCDVPVCRDCQMLNHNGHTVKLLQEEIVLAKRDLRKDKRRLSNCKHKVNGVLENVKANQYDLVKQRRTVKQVVDDWEDDLITIVKQECAAVRKKAIGSVYNATEKLKFSLEQDESRLRTNMQTVESLEKDVSEALQGGNSQRILKLRKEMKTGRGSKTRLDQLSHSCADVQAASSTHTPLLYVNNITERDIRSLLRQAQPVLQVPKIRHMFQCAGNYIHDIVPTEDGRVWVAQESSWSTILYTSSGRITWRATTDAHDRECIVRIRARYYLVSTRDNLFHDLTARRLESTSINSETYSLTDLLFSAYWSATDAFSADPHLEENITRVSYDTTEERLCVLSKHDLRAMDADKDGKVFAVLDDCVAHLLVYRYGDKQPFATYNAGGAAFDPRDVCFCEIGGRERLIVADCQSDSLHVLDVRKHSCKLLGHMGRDSPLLVKPIKLCPDNMGRLW
ncbi:hypothetical protein BaRGS_00016775, partial [Batillaria attramentaria]